ncbi:hypothetical protein [Methylovulum miyakonense]|uniref:hypothetical protein n=1 Tax=Methylovulum miyakonense TaxID=645578 RepID=UPI000369BF48|nr:hypothetical protein [Methylovulum miyakonense]
MEIAQITIAFLFGVSFVITLLVVAVKYPNPTAFQYNVFRIILSLAASGVAAMIPGFINLELSTGTELLIRAGGAIAVFVIIFFFNPAPLILSKTLENYKNEIDRQNKNKDKEVENISLVVQKIRECDKAFNAMLTAFARQSCTGPFEDMADIVSKDDNLKESYRASYLESVNDFGSKTSELMATVNSCSFWIGEDLSSKAKEIAEAYSSIIYGIINNNKDGKASEVVKNIDGMISAFEADARKHLV